MSTNSCDVRLKLFNAIYYMVPRDPHTFGTRAMKEAEHRVVLFV